MNKQLIKVNLFRISLLVSILFIFMSSLAYTTDMRLQALNQTWKAGKWTVIQDSNLANAAYVKTPDGKRLGFLFCKKCGSINVIDSEVPAFRILPSTQAKSEDCDHIWTPGFSTLCFEPIFEKDYLIILVRDEITVLRIDKIVLPFSEIKYSISKLNLKNIEQKIDISDLRWKSKTARSNIPIGESKIEFHSDPSMKIEGKYYIEIKYDQCYGGVFSPSGENLELILPIAIVHSSDICDKNTIDLTEFKFKTWEDGLGNKTNPQSYTLEISNAVDIKKTFQVHQGTIYDLILSPDGKYFVSTGKDKRLIITYFDDCMSKVLGPSKFGQGVKGIAISQDASIVISATDLLDNMFIINSTSGRYEVIKNLPGKGSIVDIAMYDNDQKITYITAAHELVFFDLKTKEVIDRRKVAGGFIGNVSFSSNRKYIAVTSCEEKDGKSAGPSYLTIFDFRGNEVLLYEFKESSPCIEGKVIFVNPQLLAFCLPSGRVCVWELSVDSLKWTKKCELEIIAGPLTAITTSYLKSGVIYMAKGDSVWAIDVYSREILGKADLRAGEADSNVINYSIVALAEVPATKSLAIAFGDGKVKLVSLSVFGKY